MNYKDKPKEELIKELLELQQEYNSLKTLYDQSITERRQVEQKLIIAKEKAQAGERLKTAVHACFLHEIRTPLNGILGFTGLLADPDISVEEQRQYIQIIEKQSRIAMNIISEELAFQNGENENRNAEFIVAKEKI